MQIRYSSVLKNIIENKLYQGTKNTDKHLRRISMNIDHITLMKTGERQRRKQSDNENSADTDKSLYFPT